MVLGQPEVRDVGHALLVQQDVAGLDVPVHQSGRVHRVETRGHPQADLDRRPELERAVALDLLRERPALDKRCTR